MKAAKVQVAVVILCSVVLEIPRIFEYEIIQQECYGRVFYVRRNTYLGNHEVYQILYRTILYSLLRKYIPLLVVSILTFHLVRFLAANRKLRKTVLSNGINPWDPSIDYLTKVLAVIACMYIICGTPSAIYPILRLFADTESGCATAFDYFVMIGDLLPLLNSSLNFFVYYVNITAFRKCLKVILKNCCIRRKKARYLYTVQCVSLNN